MLDSINSVEDIKAFFSQLYHDGSNFQADTPFEDCIYINSGESVFGSNRVAELNELLLQCFMICARYNVDICEVAVSP